MRVFGTGSGEDIAGAVRQPRDGWIERRESIPFRLGISLFNWSFLALRRELFFENLSRPQSESDVPYALLRKGLEALILVPCPAALAGSAAGRITFLGNAIRYLPVTRTTFYIGLRGTFADYLSKLQAKARHELIRKRRRFIEIAGGIDPVIRQYRTPSEAEQFYRLARLVSVKTYQSHIGVGIPDDIRFRAHLIAEAARDRLRGFILFLKDRPVAFGFCLIEGDILLYMKTGYDPEFSACSPGSVLLYGMLEQSFADRQCTVMDLGVGTGQWKRLYSTEERTFREAYYFRKTLTNAGLVTLHRTLTALSDSGGRLLARLHLKERYRKLLRSA